MPVNAYECANKFICHMNYVEPTRAKMEVFINNGSIVRRDIELIYAGLYLEAVCSFERFLEHLFMGLLVGRFLHPSSEVVPRVKFKSDLVARDVVFSGNRYLDWLPYNHAEQRAKAYFRNGKPFTDIAPRDRQIIDQICCLRNAIAHKSDYSIRKFANNVIGTTPLLSKEKTPSGFLRSTFRITPAQTRYENFITEMAGIALKLCQ